MNISDGSIEYEVRTMPSTNELGYRQPNTAYTVDNITYHNALPIGWYLECTTAGTSGGGDLTISTPAIGDMIADGTATWMIRKTMNTKNLQGIEDNYIYINNENICLNLNSSNAIRLLPGSIYQNVPYLALFNDNNPTVNGCFILGARDNNSTTAIELAGTPNGKLTWNNMDLASSAIIDKSITWNGYIKYASGLIIQWISVAAGGENSGELTLPIAFSGNWSAFVTFNGNVQGQACTITGVEGYSLVHWTRTGVSYGLRIVAIGY